MVTRKARLRAQYDEKQQVLNPHSQTGTQSRDTYIIHGMTVETVKYHCPFCLFLGKINKFQILLKSGELAKLFKCPECHNDMRIESLTAKRTIEEYARWCFDYASAGFWDKVPFEIFRNRLHKFNMSYRFWRHYKRLKGEYIIPEQHDYPSYRKTS